MTNKNEQKEKDFLILKRKIFKDTTLDCSQYKDSYIQRRLSVRMRSTGTSSYAEYLRYLIKNKSEYEDFLNDLTINVTEFFRDLSAWKALEDEVLPMMVYNKVMKKRKVIRFWSAGCSSGEEPYTLAIIMRELLDEEFDNFLLSITATDIDPVILDTAREGAYLPRQVENIRPDWLKKYFRFDGEKYHISDEIKDMIRFKKGDLFSPYKSRHYDLITCRNVMIYFNKEMHIRLFEEFHQCLNTGGYLMIGKTENLIGTVSENFETLNARERIYQKS